MKLRHGLEVIPVGNLFHLRTDVTFIDGFSGEAPENTTSPMGRLVDDPNQATGRLIISIEDSTPIIGAVGTMLEYDISALIVDGPSKGIVTHRDLFRRRNLDLGAPIWDIATRTVEAVHVELPIAYPLYLMVHGGLRHVPVEVEEGRPWRMLSANDLLRFSLLFFNDDPLFDESLGSIIEREDRDELAKFTAPVHFSMEQVAEKASRLNAGALLVMDGEELVGLISEKDNLRRLSEGRFGDTSVYDWMTTRDRLIIVEEGASVAEAIQLLLTHGIRHLVLHLKNDGYRIIGVKRFLNRFAEEAPGLVNLPLTPSSARGIEKTPGSVA